LLQLIEENANLQKAVEKGNKTSRKLRDQIEELKVQIQDQEPVKFQQKAFLEELDKPIEDFNKHVNDVAIVCNVFQKEHIESLNKTIHEQTEFVVQLNSQVEQLNQKLGEANETIERL
jgi:methyl-accepting chemotaxis protein